MQEVAMRLVVFHIRRAAPARYGSPGWLLNANTPPCQRRVSLRDISCRRLLLWTASGFVVGKVVDVQKVLRTQVSVIRDDLLHYWCFQSYSVAQSTFTKD